MSLSANGMLLVIAGIAVISFARHPAWRRKMLPIVFGGVAQIPDTYATGDAVGDAVAVAHVALPSEGTPARVKEFSPALAMAPMATPVLPATAAEGAPPAFGVARVLTLPSESGAPPAVGALPAVQLCDACGHPSSRSARFCGACGQAVAG